MLLSLLIDVSDFLSTAKTVTFPALTSMFCVPFDIIDNNVIETDETFVVRISTDDRQINEPDADPVVRIIDDDGKLSLHKSYQP